jgi:hypothetical protein
MMANLGSSPLLRLPFDIQSERSYLSKLGPNQIKSPEKYHDGGPGEEKKCRPAQNSALENCFR